MAQDNRKYGIVTVANADTLDYSELDSNDSASCRCNDQDGNAATEKIISWCVTTYPSNPPTLSGKLETVDSRTVHTLTEIDAIIAADLNWFNPANIN